MSAASVIMANLIDFSMAPLTLRTGATSESNPDAGVSTGGELPTILTDTITTGDKAGAGVLTVFVSLVFFGGAWWLVS
ncbi:hypothetical protein DV738_g1, partial [Chaetothyriales sp. CBS 135597]